MSQSIKQKGIIDYPFGNPHSEQEQDTESYHSVNNDDRKFKCFDDEGQSSFYKKGSQSMLRKKNPLPPLYPYQQIQKLKQSMKLQNKGIDQSQANQGENFDTKSVRSVDSFHTANQFQSICYQEGDYEKIVGQMGQNEQDEKSQESRKNKQWHFQEHKQEEKIQQSSKGSFEARDFRHNSQKDKGQLKMQMQRSNALDEAQLLQLEESQLSQQIYEKFDQREGQQRTEVKPKQQFRQNQQQNQQRHQQNRQKVFNPVQQEQKSVEISRIQQVLNQSVQLDQEILQLTRQLQQAHSSQQEILMKKKVDRQIIKSNLQLTKSDTQMIKSDTQMIRKQEQLNSRYQSIEKRMCQLQKSQKTFTKQVSSISQILKRTQQNNNYLKKQVQFFKQKVKSHLEKQKQQQRKQKQSNPSAINNNNKSINKDNPSSSIFSSLQQKLKPKTYNIRPKIANNQSYQSRKYKQLTFQYCNRQQQQLKNREQQQWIQLDIDRENNPLQYKIVYSFQQQNTLLVIRLVDIQVQTKHNKDYKDGNKPIFSPTHSIIKKNYQYMMDFAHNKYQTQQQKLQSLTKQLILHLNDQFYSLKQFTKKIQLFLIITEEQTYIDMVKVVPLPNPIAFYIEKRFNLLLNGQMNKIKQRSKSPQHSKGQQQRQQNSRGQKQQRSYIKNNNNLINPLLSKNILNLYKLMKTYIIKIQHMADVQTVHKLISLQWINNNSDLQPKYFSIRYKQKVQNSSKRQISNSSKRQAQNSQRFQVKNQLFYVKIQDCVLENSISIIDRKQKIDKEQYRYSLVLKVASNQDNALLVDLIEFLTFLTVL